MKTSNTKAKEKILQAVLELVVSEESIENITTRQIAEKAKVNLALINYYYQSKENLLSQVAEIKMASIISQTLESYNSNMDATTRLKELLVITANFSFEHNDIFKIAITKELKEGCKNSCALIVPFLRELFKNKDETEIKIIALQLMTPFHQMVLYPNVYKSYLNTDFFEEQQRTQLINKMVDSILRNTEVGNKDN